MWLSVHLKIEEKISLTSGRDGGLQSMEILGIITLRVSDDKFGRIRLQITNNDKKGVQLQVVLLSGILRCTFYFRVEKVPGCKKCENLWCKLARLAKRVL